MARKDENSLKTCPCQSETPYADCCEPLHRGQANAKTAAQLMRSRYSAYALKLTAYLVETTHPDQRTERLAEEIASWAAQVEFIKLEIVACSQGEGGDKIGKVEFIASYRHAGQTQQLREKSRFKRFKKKWRYLDGIIEEN